MYYSGYNNRTTTGIEEHLSGLYVNNDTLSSSYIYPNSSFSINFNVSNATASDGISKTYLNITRLSDSAVLHENKTGVGGIYNWNTSNIYDYINYIDEGTNNIYYKGESSLGTNYTNTSSVFVYSGVNITNFVSTNGTVWLAFDWSAKNTTNTYAGNKNVGSYINSSLLPTGTVTFNLRNSTWYLNSTFILTLNTTPYFITTNRTVTPYGYLNITSLTSCDGKSWSSFYWSAVNSTGSIVSGTGTVGTAIPFSSLY
jgi:hypothetical protein